MAQGNIHSIIGQPNYMTIPDGRTLAWNTYSVPVGGHKGTIWGSANTGLYIHSIDITIPFGITFKNNPYLLVTKAGGSGSFVSWIRWDTQKISSIDLISPVETPTSGSEYIITWLAIGYKA